MAASLKQLGGQTSVKPGQLCIWCMCTHAHTV